MFIHLATVSDRINHESVKVLCRDQKGDLVDGLTGETQSSKDLDEAIQTLEIQMENLKQYRQDQMVSRAISRGDHLV